MKFKSLSKMWRKREVGDGFDKEERWDWISWMCFLIILSLVVYAIYLNFFFKP
jgi:hypothetical protein